MQLINSDTEVTPELTGELVRVAESDPRIAVVGCRNMLMEDPARLWGAYSTLTYGPFLVRSDGAGAADGPALARRARRRRRHRQRLSVAARGARSDIGLLDEAFFGYHEDVEWCMRARRAGWRVVYAGSAAIVHRGGSSSAPGHARIFPARYFLGRNAVAFVRRYARPRRPGPLRRAVRRRAGGAPGARGARAPARGAALARSSPTRAVCGTACASGRCRSPRSASPTRADEGADPTTAMRGAQPLRALGLRRRRRARHRAAERRCHGAAHISVVRAWDSL